MDVLSDRDKCRLENNYITAYGSTANAALIMNNKILTISIGDGGIFFVHSDFNRIDHCEDDEDNVANITNSLCNDDVFSHLSVNIYEKEDIAIVFCVTDGVVNPYQSYDNFNNSFAIPFCKELLSSKKGIYKAKEFIKTLGIYSGIGDDVSIALYMNIESKSFKGKVAKAEMKVEE